MAEDIAALGLSVDSKPVAQASAELDKFAGAAKGAEQAAQTFQRSTTQASTASEALAKNVNKAANSAAAINARLNVRDTFSGADRAAEIDAYGKALDDLRAKYNPLFAIERQHQAALVEINSALRVGAITQEEHAKATQRAGAAATAQTNAVNKAGKEIELLGRRGGLAGFQLTNLSFQLNDIATMAALGASPLRILASQGGQVFQILQQGPEGVMGSLRSLGAGFLSLLTPINLVIAASAGFGTAGLAAALAWDNAQSQIKLALLGVGAASGVTINDINGIAVASAAAGKASAGEAQDMATAFAATGRVTADLTLKATLLGRQVSRVFGEDITEATQRLAKALVDPGKGVDDANRRLAAFDATTAEHIKRLQAQGNLYQAQKLYLDGIEQGTRGAADATSRWTSAWDALSDTASNFWNMAKQNSAEALGFGTIESKVEAVRKKLETLQNQGALQKFFGEGIARTIEELGPLEVELERILTLRARDAVFARQNRDSNDLMAVVRGLSDEAEQLNRIVDTRTKLDKLTNDGNVVNRLPEAALKELEIAKQILTLRETYYKTSVEKAQEEYEIGLMAINARTAAQKGELAYRQAFSREISGADPQNAFLKAGQAQSLAILEFNKQILQTQKDQVLAANQKIQASDLELSLVGRTNAEQEKARALLQVKQQLQSEAMRLYGDENAIVQKQLEALQKRAAQEAEVNRLVKERQFYADLEFQRNQIARAPGEQDVYSKLQQAGLLTNGEIKGAAAEAAAAQVRLNYLLQQNMDASKDFAKGFVQDMLAGKTATEALVNSLNRLASKLADIGMDYAFQSIFGGKGGGNSLIGSMFGFGGSGSSTTAGTAANGGWSTTVVPTFHQGGIVGAGGQSRAVPPSVFSGARRYHGGGLAGLMGGEVPAILQKGEVVLPKGWGGGKGSSSVNAPVTFHIDARGATPDAVAMLNARLESIVAQLPGTIVKTVREARDRGHA